jgi:hypothetical protein
MRNLQVLAFLLLAPVLLRPVALAQTNEPQTESALLPSVAAARCQYAPAEAACHSASGGQADSNAGATTAQLPPRVPTRMHPPRAPRPFPQGGYPRQWMAPNPRDTAIGAAIGFGLGAAIGAKAGWCQPAGTAMKTSLLIGGIGALVGGGLGSIPSFQARNWHHHGPWHDRRISDEDELASNRDDHHTQEAGTTVQHSGEPKILP